MNGLTAKNILIDRRQHAVGVSKTIIMANLTSV